MTQALNYSHGIRAFPFVRFTASYFFRLAHDFDLSITPHTHTQATMPFSEEEHDTFVFPVLACHIWQ